MLSLGDLAAACGDAAPARLPLSGAATPRQYTTSSAATPRQYTSRTVATTDHTARTPRREMDVDGWQAFRHELIAAGGVDGAGGGLDAGGAAGSEGGQTAVL